MRVGVVLPALVGGTPQEPVFEPPTSGNVGLTPSTVSGTTLTYTITEGGAGDADGVVNGVIVDPAAPFISATFTG